MKKYFIFYLVIFLTSCVNKDNPSITDYEITKVDNKMIYYQLYESSNMLHGLKLKKVNGTPEVGDTLRRFLYTSGWFHGEEFKLIKKLNP